MNILTALSHQLTWEEFLTYRLQKGRFNWHEFDVADTFVSEKLYLPVVESMLRGEGLSIPTKHLVNKMGSGKKRVVYSFEDDEMNVLKCLSYLLYRFDSTLSPNCYSFRCGLTAHDAIHDILRATNGRHMWAYKVDIHNYFNSISIPLLLPILRELLAEDPTLYRFFEQILTEECAIFKGEIVHEEHGVMAGTPISPFLANIYLTEVDQHFAENGVIYARYSDDIILFAPDEPTLMQHIETLKAFLDKYRLEVNPEKEQIYRPDEPFEYLGFKCFGNEIDISEATKRKMKDKIRRKTRLLLRWRTQKDIPADAAMKGLIRYFNRKFFERDDIQSLTWSRWFFPMITRTDGLKEIDHYLQDNLRFLATGKHNKANYRIRYPHLKSLGYRSLVHEYYAFSKNLSTECNK